MPAARSLDIDTAWDLHLARLVMGASDPRTRAALDY
jgi:hypothetical protein